MARKNKVDEYKEHMRAEALDEIDFWFGGLVEYINNGEDRNTINYKCAFITGMAFGYSQLELITEDEKEAILRAKREVQLSHLKR